MTVILVRILPERCKLTRIAMLSTNVSFSVRKSSVRMHQISGFVTRYEMHDPFPSPPPPTRIFSSVFQDVYAAGYHGGPNWDPPSPLNPSIANCNDVARGVLRGLFSRPPWYWEAQASRAFVEIPAVAYPTSAIAVQYSFFILYALLVDWEHRHCGRYLSQFWLCPK